jgi:hypothetical protein
MTAFERQVAGEMLGRAGSVRPVDDLAIYESVAAARRSHRWGFTVFSALKFVAAAAIVALFGGFLLAGVLTTPSDEDVLPVGASASPSAGATVDLTLIPTDDPVVFEVALEPHLEWLLADENHLGPLAIDHHGGIWVQGWEGEEGYVVELGVGDTGAFTPVLDDLAFNFDGTLWGSGASGGLRSFDGHAWTRHSARPWRTELADDAFTFDFRGVVDLTEAPDGTLYGITESMDLAKVEDGEVRRRALGTDWAGMSLAARAVAITPDGTIWIGGRMDSGNGIFADHTGAGMLLRLDGLSSERATPLGAGVYPYVADLAVAPDGALWALLWTADGSRLARYDGQTWTAYSSADGLPEVGYRTFAGNGDRLAVGPDGRVWFSLFHHTPEEPVTEGDGIVEFDGESFVHYLGGVRVDDLAIASDGSVWTTTDQGLYVITPGPMTGTQ